MTFARSPPAGANSGMCLTTGSERRSRPSSTRIITDGAVATTLVREAMSNTVSTVIGSANGTAIYVRNVADMKNVGGPYGGAIVAALFLAEFVGDTPDQFAEYIRVEVAKWAKVIKDADIRL